MDGKMKSKKSIVFIILGLVLALLMILGVFIIKHNYCGNCKIKDLPKDPIVFQTGEWKDVDPNGQYEDNNYRIIKHDGKNYIMYGKIKNRFLFDNYTYAFGDCLGYVDDDKEDRIYALKGDDTGSWLIEHHVGTNLMNDPVVLMNLSLLFRSFIDVPNSVEELGYNYFDIGG